LPANVSPHEEGGERMRAKWMPLTAALLTGVLICGCRIDSEKHGDNQNVKVATPFGGVQVKTNEADGISGIGIPVYPGAQPVKKDKDNGSADVNLSFGHFQLRVKAVSYRTPDSPDKVKAFYQNVLKRYGAVIECNHDQPVGTPTQTDEGLTCSDGDRKHAMTTADTSGKTELKTGSKQHQHIVAIDPEDAGTKFGLVALDLPSRMSFGTNNPDQRQ